MDGFSSSETAREKRVGQRCSFCKPKNLEADAGFARRLESAPIQGALQVKRRLLSRRALATLRTGTASFSRAAFWMGRAQFVARQFSVAVFVQREKRLRRLGDFVRINLAVLVQVERSDDRRHWRRSAGSSAFASWRAILSEQNRRGNADRHRGEQPCHFIFHFVPLFDLQLSGCPATPRCRKNSSRKNIPTHARNFPGKFRKFENVHAQKLRLRTLRKREDENYF